MGSDNSSTWSMSKANSSVKAPRLLGYTRVGYHVLDVPSHSAVLCSRVQEPRANTSAACFFQQRGILSVVVLCVAIFHSSERSGGQILAPVFVKACAS
jgi:hypothetical protein